MIQQTYSLLPYGKKHWQVLWHRQIVPAQRLCVTMYRKSAEDVCCLLESKEALIMRLYDKIHALKKELADLKQGN